MHGFVSSMVRTSDCGSEDNSSILLPTPFNKRFHLKSQIWEYGVIGSHIRLRI